MRFTQEPDGTLVSSAFFVGTKVLPLCGDKQPPEEHDWKFENPLVAMVITKDIAESRGQPQLEGRVIRHQTCAKCKYTRAIIPPKKE